MKTIKKFQYKRAIVLSGLAFFSFLLFAEGSCAIKGKVTDEKNQPVEYATAVLRNSLTNKFVTGTVCNYYGEFVIEDVEVGEYVLSTNMIGYEKNESIKIVLDKDQHRVVSKEIVMNEIPGKSIVVRAKKNVEGKNLQTAQR